MKATTLCEYEFGCKRLIQNVPAFARKGRCEACKDCAPLGWCVHRMYSKLLAHTLPHAERYRLHNGKVQ